MLSPKTREKRSDTSHKSQMRSTTARREADCRKPASPVPLLHCRLCSFWKGKTSETFEATKIEDWLLKRFRQEQSIKKSNRKNKTNKQINKRTNHYYQYQEPSVFKAIRRGSGGVIELVRNVLIHFMKQIEIDYDNFIILGVLKNFLVRMQMYFWLILPDNGTAMLEQCLVSILCKRMKMFPLFYVAIWTLEWGVRFRLILTLHCRILKRLDVISGWTKAQQDIWAPNAAQEILKKMNTSPVYWCCVQVLIYMFWTEHVMVTRVVCTITYPLLVIVFWLFYIFSLSLFSAWGKNASVGKNWFQTHASYMFYALPNTAKLLQRSRCYRV